MDDSLYDEFGNYLGEDEALEAGNGPQPDVEDDGYLDEAEDGDRREMEDAMALDGRSIACLSFANTRTACLKCHHSS